MSTKKIKSTSKSPKRRPHKKGLLPQKLPITSARRAVERASGHGYLMALIDLGLFRAEIRDGRQNLLPDHIRNLFLEDTPLNLDLDVYMQVTAEHTDNLQNLLGHTYADVVISEAHTPSLNLPGRDPVSDILLTAAAKRKRKHRPLKKQPPKA